LTKFLRDIFNKPLEAIANYLDRLGITANTITLIGLTGNITAAFFIGRGQFLAGAIILIFLSPLDAVDGALSRVRNKETKFGAFLDSICDRYSEIAVIFGILVFFLNKNDFWGVIFSFLAVTGSVLVSYVRARAEALGGECKIGILTRVERYLLIIIVLLINQVEVGVGILAVFSHITAFQRIIHVQKLLDGKN